MTTFTKTETINLKNTVTENRLKGLWRLMEGFRWEYLGAALSLGLAATARTGLYLLLGYFVDTFLLQGNSRWSLPTIAFGFIGLAIITGGFSFISGALAAHTSEGIARWDGQDWQTYPDTYSGTIYSFEESIDSTLWVGTVRGLFRWTGSDWYKYGDDKGLQNDFISNLVQGTNGIMYLSTKDGLYQYNSTSDRWEPFPN